MAKPKLSFEEALANLEALAGQIEQGQIGLEESISKYEEGMGLIKQCRKMLTDAEHKIQKLHERADGTLETRPMKNPAPRENDQQ